MFEGMYTALVTPFIENNNQLEIDWKSYENLIEWQLEAGVDGLVLYATTGESPTLSPEEKIALTTRAKEIVKGRIPLVVGVGSNSTAQTCQFVTTVQEYGIDGVLVVAPYYNKPSQEGLFQHFSEIAKVSKTPVIVYNVPSRTSVDISIDTFCRLAKVPNIAGVKQAVDSISNISELCGKTAGDWTILSGDDPSTLFMMLLGGKGVISASASAIPNEMVALVKACSENEWSKASLMQRDLIEKFKALFLETNPSPAKAVLKNKGIIKTDFVRLPLVPVSDSTQSVLKALFS